MSETRAWIIFGIGLFFFIGGLWNLYSAHRLLRRLEAMRYDVQAMIRRHLRLIADAHARSGDLDLERLRRMYEPDVVAARELLADDARWDAAFASSQPQLAKLAARAHAAYDAGRTQPLEPWLDAPDLEASRAAVNVSETGQV